MAGKKQQAPKPIEEDEEVEGEGWDNAAEVEADAPDAASGRMRDWRDVEKYREMRELRRLVGDDFDFTDVLGEIPVRSEAQRKPDAKGKAVLSKVAPVAAVKGAAAPAKGAAPIAKAPAAIAKAPAVAAKGKPVKAAPPPPPAKKPVAKPAAKAKPVSKLAAKPKAKPAKAKKK